MGRMVKKQKKNRLSLKKVFAIAVCSVVGLGVFSSTLSYAYHIYWTHHGPRTVYSDGHRSTGDVAGYLPLGSNDFEAAGNYFEGKHYGEIFVADGFWGPGEQSPWPDPERTRGTGVRESTEDIDTILNDKEEQNGVMYNVREIQKSTDSTDKTTNKIQELAGSVYGVGEDALGHANDSIFDAMNQEDSVYKKDKLDLTKYHTVINPEKREELEKLSGFKYDKNTGTYVALGESGQLTYSERKALKESYPVIDIQNYDVLNDPEKRAESQKKAYDYYRQVSDEAAAARTQMMSELQELEAAMQPLMDVDARSRLSEKEKLTMVKALKIKMEALEMKLNHINAEEAEVQRLYERKKQLESVAQANNALAMPSYDPYNPTDGDKNTFQSTSTNFGILSFK